MEVELCGRVQYQRVGRFLTLRDQYGMTQVVAPDDVSSLMIGGVAEHFLLYCLLALLTSVTGGS
jgi:aspartyl-tRNA synthetase